MAGPTIDEVPDNVFKVSSRINSTWGGNLVDMVRSPRYLEIIEQDGLVDHAATVGAHLLRRARRRCRRSGPDLFSNARGRGLMCAIDFPDGPTRDKVADEAYEMGLIILGCGQRSAALPSAARRQRRRDRRGAGHAQGRRGESGWAA